MSGLDTKFLKTKPYKVDRSYSKYQNFWQRLETPTTASSYLTELIAKVMHLEAYKKSLKADDLLELEIIAVMYGLALNYQIGDLFRAKVDDKLKKPEPQAQHPFIQKIISNIYKLLIDKEEIIGSIISQACFSREPTEDTPNKLGPDVIGHYKTIKSLSDHTNSFYQALRAKDVEILETGEFCFVYEYVVKYINKMKKNKREVPKELILGICNTAKIIKYSLHNLDSAQVSACALLHLIRQVLTFYPIREPDTLKEFGSILEMFRKWPLPAGLMADSCFKILLAEMKSPGAMMRDYLRENFPLLDFMTKENENFEEGMKHIVYCIIEDSLEVDDIVSYSNSQLDVEPNLDSHQIRGLIISYVLETIIGNVRINEISGLSVQDVFTFYTRIIHILEKTSELNNISDCRNVQKSAFEELLKEISSTAPAAFSKANLVKAFKENPTLIVPFPSAQFIPLNKTADKSKDSVFHKRSSSFTFANPKQAIKEQLMNSSRLQYTSIFENIKAIIEQSKRPEMPMHEEPIKFMVVGGEAEIFGFVQDLLGVFVECPQLFRRIDLRVYLVPTSYSAIAQYIAAHDFWYQRYVYVPFKMSPIIPKLEYTGKSHSDSQTQGKSLSDISMTDKRIIFPTQIKENMMQTYVREANYKFPPVVYQILCYASTTEEIKLQQPSKVFYFFQYVDIGVGVMRHKQRIEKKLKPDTPFYELDNKLTKKFYLDLKIKAEYCEMSGYTHKSEDCVERSIHDMSISNVPREYTKGALPFPTSGWLEVSYLDFENFKAEDNAMKDKDKFKKTKPEHINAAFSALYTNIHVKKISIWTQERDQTIEFVADGTLCGPCRQIDISPVVMNNHMSDPYFTLPIMTFFPIQM